MTDGRTARWLAVGLTATIAVPILIVTVRMIAGPTYHPTVDWAIFELRVRDTAHGLLTVGPYSRYGWNHPGPMLFYLLAGPYRLSGESSISMNVTAALVNLACVVGGAVVGWRRMRLAGVVAVLVPLALTVHSFGVDQIRDPWNPYLPILPLFLLVLLAWSLADGDRWCAVPLALVVSFVVQSHVGFAGAVAAVLAVTAVVLVVTRPKGPWRAVSLTSLAVLVVCWLPVFVGTVVDGDGNLRKLVDFFRSDQPTAGLGKALRVMGLQWGPRPDWIFGSRGTTNGIDIAVESRWWLAVVLVAAVAATVVAVRRGRRTVGVLAALVGAGTLAALLSVVRVVGPMFGYLTRWTWALGALLGVVILAGVLSVCSARAVRMVACAALALLVGLGVAMAVSAADVGLPQADRQRGERVLAQQVISALPPGSGRVEISGAHSILTVPGLALALERHGIPVAISPASPIVYGDRRSPGSARPRARLEVYEGDSAAQPHPGRRIGHYVQRGPDGKVLDRTAVYLLAN